MASHVKRAMPVLFLQGPPTSSAYSSATGLEVHTLSEKKNSGMEYQVGFSGEQFSSNLLSGWDHHALERVKL